MKAWKKIAGVSVLMGVLLVSSTTSANTTLPGSVEDPLITKSYMDEQVNKVKAELKTELKAELKAEIKAEMGNGGGSATGSGAKLVVVKLETGQFLVAREGTEVIVRSGHVVGTLSPGGDGIPDLTEGVDIKGTKIAHNHLLLFPRDDGRGIKVLQGPSYVMIRGSYEIK
jgi:hypothetical protein